MLRPIILLPLPFNQLLSIDGSSSSSATGGTTYSYALRLIFSNVPQNTPQSTILNRVNNAVDSLVSQSTNVNRAVPERFLLQPINAEAIKNNISITSLSANNSSAWWISLIVLAIFALFSLLICLGPIAIGLGPIFIGLGAIPMLIAIAILALGVSVFGFLWIIGSVNALIIFGTIVAVIGTVGILFLVALLWFAFPISTCDSCNSC